MRTLRELQALALLVLRSWYRTGPRVRGGHKPEPTRGLSAALMRLVFAALIYNFGFTSGISVLREHTRLAWSATWAGVGAGCFVLATTFALELPSPRMPTQPLKSDLLELLPLSSLSKLLLALAQAALTLPLSVALAVTLRGAQDPGAPLLPAVALGLSMFFVFGLSGACLGKLVRLVFSSYGASRLSWLSMLPMLGGILLLQFAPLRDRLQAPWFGDGLGRALTGEGVGNALLGLLGSAFALSAAYFWLERRHELSAPVRPGSTASAFGKGAGMARLERVLNRREPGGAFQVPFVTMVSALVIGGLSWALADDPGSHRLWMLAAAITLQMVSTLGMQRASRGATRDMLARPLLGALPLSPNATLSSKVAELRGTLLLVAAPLVLVLLGARHAPALLPELGWRLLVTLLSVAVYASAAVYVAFLSTGLGAARPRGGVFGSLESFLVAVPFAGVLFAPGPLAAALSLCTLAALAFEARRAALATIDWLDDPEREHATEVWKALVVFGGFQGAQLLTQQLASLFADLVSPSLQLLGAYSLAAVALWAMTLREQESSKPAARWAFAPWGLLAGALSGGGAWLYLRLVQPRLEDAAALRFESTAEAVLGIVAIVVVAPLVEERFFRGWLQLALERAFAQRPGAPRATYLAPVLTALAFAVAHPPHSFLPVLVLGLLNGLLMRRCRSLSACVLAHAVHNAIALYLGSR